MENWDDAVHELEEKIGYVFNDKQLVKQAFTHRSFANEQLIRIQPSYERFEFLGDAVLDLIASEYLMDTYPEMAEGDLTKARSRAVCESALAHNAMHLELGKYVLLGRGEKKTGGHDRISIIADVLEALIGALYRDGGLLAAKEFVNQFVLNELPEKIKFRDSKSLFQEFVMKNNLGTINYDLASVSGPEHEKIFTIDLYLNEKLIGSGKGKNKKIAEQKAANIALEKLKPGTKCI